MATVDRSFAENLKSHDGFYNGEDEYAPDNPRAVRIVEYTDMGGKLAYGVTFESDRDHEKYLRETEFVQKPRIYWQYAG